MAALFSVVLVISRLSFLPEEIPLCGNPLWVYSLV
jgi:hypothetical protein